MLTNDQSGFSQFAPLILRVALGVFCIRLGLWGYVSADPFRGAVQEYAGSSGVLLSFYATLGPYLLFGLGALLAVGLFTRISAALTVLFLLPLFLSAGALSTLSHPLILLPEQRTIYKDFVILVGIFSLILSGAGGISADNALRAMYGKS